MKFGTFTNINRTEGKRYAVHFVLLLSIILPIKLLNMQKSPSCTKSSRGNKP